MRDDIPPRVGSNFSPEPPDAILLRVLAAPEQRAVHFRDIRSVFRSFPAPAHNSHCGPDADYEAGQKTTDRYGVEYRGISEKDVQRADAGEDAE